MRQIGFYFIICLVLICTLQADTRFNAAQQETGAQTSRTGRAVIKGTVKDANSDEALPGANVILSGTSLGAATDLGGSYRITAVVPGEYKLRFNYIGYQSVEREIKVEPGQTVIQNASLNRATVQGEQVTVTAQAEGQMQAINQQLSARTISNIVASDRIQELPDANAGESVGRLPGVSLLRSGGEGNQVTIRGLAPKYNLISIDGVHMPSTSNTNRSVDLNMISSEMLEGIELIKAPTADQDAEMLGGTVDFKLRKAPKGFRANLNLEGGYNSQQNSYDMYKFVGNASNRFLADKLGVFVQGNYEKKDRGSDNLNSGWNADQVNRTALFSSLNLEDILEDRFRYGASMILDYQLPEGAIKYNTFYSHLKRDVLERQVRYNGIDVGHRIQHFEANTNVFSTNLDIEYNIGLLNFDGGVAYVKSTKNTPFNKQLTFLQPGAVSLAPGSRFADLQPRQVLPAYQFDAFKSSWTGSGGGITSRDVWEDELSTDLNVTLPFSLLDGIISADFKFGGKYRRKTRENDIEELTMWEGVQNANSTRYRNWILDHYPEYISQDKDKRTLEASTVLIAGFLDQDYDTGEFLGGDFELIPLMSEQALEDVTEVYYDFNERHARQSEKDDHKGSEDSYAGYVMTDIKIGSKLQFIPGFRYEQFSSEYTAARSISGTNAEMAYNGVDTTTTNQNDYLLPMIHLKYRPFDWFDIRLAYTRTLTRPDYHSFTPFVDSPTPGGGTVDAGNIFLEPALSTNYDVYFSFYSNKLGLLTVGGYYKKIDDLVWPINHGFPRSFQEQYSEQFQIPQIYLTDRPYFHSWINNPHPTIVQGIELEWQTNFWYLPGLLKWIVLDMNYSLIKSEAEYIKKELAVSGGFPPTTTVVDTIRAGRLLHQPNNIFNMAIGYDYLGFSSRLSMLFQGNTITHLGTDPLLDKFSEDYFRMDAKFRQKLPIKGLEVYLNLNNLLDTPEKSVQSNKGYLSAASYYGFTSELGLRFRY